MQQSSHAPYCLQLDLGSCAVLLSLCEQNVTIFCPVKYTTIPDSVIKLKLQSASRTKTGVPGPLIDFSCHCGLYFLTFIIVSWLKLVYIVFKNFILKQMQLYHLDQHLHAWQQS